MTLEITSHPEVKSNIDLLSAWIEAQMAYTGLPGLSIGVVFDQELVWARGFGYANIEQKKPAAPQTVYRIASITKLFTATSILQLRDAGKLQLDDPITKHLPWFNIKNRYPDAPPITIRHLLTHTSGLPREAPYPYWTDGNFPDREQIRESLPDQTTILPTETEWKYSNLAVTLAGEIVAAVSAQEYPDYVQKYILDPLGMASTFVRTLDAKHPRLATGYGRRLPDGTRALCPLTDSQGLTPAANMATSVEDLARFAMLQFRDGPAGGDQILRGSTLREMQRVHWLEPNWEAGWGLGFRITRQNDKTLVGHGGSVRGYRTQLSLCPPEKFAVIVLTNADDGNPLMYTEKAHEWVAPAVQEAVRPEPAPQETDPTLVRYVGRYRNAWGDLQILVLDHSLHALDPSQPDPMLSASKFVPVAEHTFRIETKDGFSAQGEPAVFEFDDQGKVQRLKIGENYLLPVARW